MNDTTIPQGADLSAAVDRATEQLAQSRRRQELLDNPEQITLEDAKESAALALGRQIHMAMLDKPAYPLEAEPAPLTLAQLIFGFSARYMARAEKQGKAERARKLRVLIANIKAHRDTLPEQVLAKKHAAQLDYSVKLEEIDCWQKVEAANARADIKRMEAELELLEAGQ